jgi:flagellin-like hook-associated protein FlgL
MSKTRRTASTAPFNGRKISSANAKASSTVERRVATPRPDLVVIKIGDSHKKSAVSLKERVPNVIARVVRVLNRPGTDRKRIFRSTSGKTVYAYSIDSKDTSKVVREDVAGQRTVGRLVSGKFRALNSAKTI